MLENRRPSIEMLLGSGLPSEIRSTDIMHRNLTIENRLTVRGKIFNQHGPMLEVIRFKIAMTFGGFHPPFSRLMVSIAGCLRLPLRLLCRRLTGGRLRVSRASRRC